MSTPLDTIIAQARALPPWRQDEVARLMELAIKLGSSPLALSAEQEREVDRRLNAPEAVASDDEVAAFLHSTSV